MVWHKPDMPASNDIPVERKGEYDALFRLLMEYASPDDAEAPQLAEWIARSAMSPDHLFRSMGLGSRTELRELLEEHFSELAAGNTKDMRWKKYFYKRLCGWPGFHG